MNSSERGKIWSSFTDILDHVYPELSAISLKKPLPIFEFGVLERSPSRKQNRLDPRCTTIDSKWKISSH